MKLPREAFPPSVLPAGLVAPYLRIPSLRAPSLWSPSLWSPSLWCRLCVRRLCGFCLCPGQEVCVGDGAASKGQERGKADETRGRKCASVHRGMGGAGHRNAAEWRTRQGAGLGGSRGPSFGPREGRGGLALLVAPAQQPALFVDAAGVLGAGRDAREGTGRWRGLAEAVVSVAFHVVGIGVNPTNVLVGCSNGDVRSSDDVVLWHVPQPM